VADEKRQELLETLLPVVHEIERAEWNAALADHLNTRFPADGILFRTMEAICADGIETDWMELAGEEVRKGGRVIQPGPQSAELSVDVVQLIDFTGPHHRHPNGEVCAIMPDREDGRFDNNPRGWAVYPPGSQHWPSGTGGRVRILFFLPGGAIEYTDREASLGSGASGAGNPS
jgi:hypothetical protein